MGFGIQSHMTRLPHSVVCISMTSDKFLSRGIIVEKEESNKAGLVGGGRGKKSLRRVEQLMMSSSGSWRFSHRGTTVKGKFIKTTLRGGEKGVGEGERAGKNFIHAREDSWKLFQKTGLH